MGNDNGRVSLLKLGSSHQLHMGIKVDGQLEAEPDELMVAVHGNSRRAAVPKKLDSSCRYDCIDRLLHRRSVHDLQRIFYRLDIGAENFFRDALDAVAFFDFFMDVFQRRYYFSG